MQASRHRECKMYSLYSGGFIAFLYKKMYSVLHRTLLYRRDRELGMCMVDRSHVLPRCFYE